MKISILLTITTIIFTQALFTQNLHSQENDADSAGNISAITADPQPTGHSSQGLEKSIENQQNIVVSHEWSATDYVAGDIVSSTYTVQLGDTLWEIAEAYLEDGIHWTIILEKNSEQVGFLPDGTQALIVEGQTLNL